MSKFIRTGEFDEQSDKEAAVHVVRALVGIICKHGVPALCFAASACLSTFANDFGIQLGAPLPDGYINAESLDAALAAVPCGAFPGINSLVMLFKRMLRVAMSG